MTTILGFSRFAYAPQPTSPGASPPLLREHVPAPLLAPRALQVAAGDAVRFSFAILSDTHDYRRCRRGQGRWVRAAVRWLNAHRPAFVVGLGDLVAGGGDCRATAGVHRMDLKTQLDELREELLEPLTAPFVPVSGNHDLAGRRSRDPRYPWRTWSRFWSAQRAQVLPAARRLGSRRSLRFEHQGVGIAVLGYYGTCGLHADELAWARKHVRPGDLVLRHVNPYGISCLHPGHCGIAMEHEGDHAPAKLTRLLRWRGVRALFSGHTHAFYSGVCNGLWFVNTGSLGRRSMEYIRGWDRSPYRKRQAFVWVDVLQSGDLHVGFWVWDDEEERFRQFDPSAFPPVVEARAVRHGHTTYGVPATCVSLR